MTGGDDNAGGDPARRGGGRRIPGPLRADAHFLVGFDGPVVPDDVRAILAAGAVPGVTLYRFANVVSPGQVRALTTSLEAANGGDLPLLVAADQETGQLVGLGDDTTCFSGAMALGATGDPTLARRVGAAVGRELRAMGVTMNLAPVCDVASNPANPSLGIRSFGDDPAEVADMAAVMVRGLASSGVVATAKHFPGKGEAVVDPHHGLPVLDLDRQRMDEVELAPFAAAVAADVPVVMVGHYDVPALTGQPGLATSLSDAVVDAVLRGDLGFDGVVVTDALDMQALAQGDRQVDDMVSALGAGVDLLLCSPDARARDRLRRGLDVAVADGRIRATRTARTVARLDALRRWVATFAQPDLDVVGCAAHRDLADEVARRAVTLVRVADGVLPLSRDGRLVAVMPRPANLTPADTSSTVAPGLAAALRRHHPDVVEVVVAQDPDSDEIARVVAGVDGASVAVVGTTWATDGQAGLVEAVAATGVPLVTAALRTPFDLARYPDVGTHLCTYDLHEPALHALADVLFGVAAPRGTLPAAIPGLHARGHGVALP